jgi:hypothetical protein
LGSNGGDDVGLESFCLPRCADLAFVISILGFVQNENKTKTFVRSCNFLFFFIGCYENSQWGSGESEREIKMMLTS